jgi:hypothetical protein
MMQRKLHCFQQIGNKFVALNSASGLAERTSVMPSDEYSKYLLNWG